MPGGREDGGGRTFRGEEERPHRKDDEEKIFLQRRTALRSVLSSEAMLRGERGTMRHLKEDVLLLAVEPRAAA